MLNSLQDFIEELEKDYSTISINENNEYKGYITIKYTQEDLDLLTDEELAEFNNIIENGFRSACDIDVNKYYKERLGITRLNENRNIEFPEMEFQLGRASHETR